jgi:hypothetical protein
VTPERRDLPEPIHEWLIRPHESAPAGWAPDLPLDEMRTHPDLVARLSEISKPAPGTRRVWVDGAPVVHHESGPPVAVAIGTSWLVIRSGQPAGALDTGYRTFGLDEAWVDLDPWTVDVAFAKGLDLLRYHVARACELASVT